MCPESEPENIWPSIEEEATEAGPLKVLQEQPKLIAERYDGVIKATVRSSALNSKEHIARLELTLDVPQYRYALLEVRFNPLTGYPARGISAGKSIPIGNEPELRSWLASVATAPETKKILVGMKRMANEGAWNANDRGPSGSRRHTRIPFT